MALEIHAGKPIKVFYSYSRKDAKLRDKLEEALSLLKRRGIISNWYDRMIGVGTEWKSQINENLETADIILLLISPSFLASDYCYDTEMKRAMERHDKGDAQIIPIILRPCYWENSPFSKLQALPKTARPVTQWRNRDEAFSDIARGVLEVVMRIVFERSEKTASPTLKTENLAIDLGKSRIDQLQFDLFSEKHIAGPMPGVVVDHFTNRINELQRLKKEIIDGKKHLILISGRSGIGKTTLVTKLLHDIVVNLNLNLDDSFHQIHSVIYVSLRQREFRFLDKIVELAIRVLEPDTAKELQAKWHEKTSLTNKLEFLFRHIFGRRHCLIVMDNLETVLDDTNHIQNTFNELEQFILAGLEYDHSAQLLITSRRTLVFPAQIEGRIGDRRIEISLDNGLPESDGIRLLRLLDSDGKLNIQNASGESLLDVVKNCHGIPRILETLVGKLRQSRTHTFERIHTDIHFFKDLLEDPARELYESLVPEARLVMQAIAIYDRPTSPNAIQYILPSLNVETILDSLVRDYAVSYDHGLFSLHPLDQQYAYRRIPDLAGQDYTLTALHTRAADYYRNIRKSSEDWKSVDDLMPQIHEFHQLIGAKLFNDACNLINEIDNHYLSVWGQYSLIIDMRFRLIGHIEDPKLEMDNLRYLGGAFDDLGKVQESITYLSDALVLARKLVDKPAIRYCLSTIGLAYWDLGQMRKAMQYHEESLMVAREIGDRRGEGIALSDMGLVFHDLGEIQKAISCREQALKINTELGEQRGVGTDLGNLGYEYYILGDNTKAVAYAKDALSIHRTIGYKQGEALDLDNIGDAMIQAEKYENSIPFYNEGLEVAKNIGHKTSLSYCFLGLALANHFLGHLTQAKSFYQDALDLDVSPTKFRCAVKLGLLYLEEHDSAKAEYYLKLGISLCQTLLDTTPEVFEALYELGLAQVATGLTDDAIESYRNALMICSAAGIVHRAIQDLELLGRSGLTFPGWGPAITLLKASNPDL